MSRWATVTSAAEPAARVMTSWVKPALLATLTYPISRNANDDDETQAYVKYNARRHWDAIDREAQ